jgi:hypothetical protein
VKARYGIAEGLSVAAIQSILFTFSALIIIYFSSGLSTMHLEMRRSRRCEDINYHDHIVLLLQS